MALKDYCDVENDMFQPEEDSRFCFPCFACRYRYHPENGEPCVRCGHNANAGKYVEKEKKKA